MRPACMHVHVQGSLVDLGALALLEPPPAREEGVSMAATRVIMHQIVMPSEVDALGICFGGQVQLPGAPDLPAR